MSKKTPDYRVTSPEEYTTGNGEVKTFFTDVGSGWSTKNGGISIKLRKNLAVSGELVIFPAREKAEGDDEGDNGIPL